MRWSWRVQLRECKYARLDVGGLPEAENAPLCKLKNDMRQDSTRTDRWMRSSVHEHNLHLPFPAPLEAARMDATTAVSNRRFREVLRFVQPVPWRIWAVAEPWVEWTTALCDGTESDGSR